MEYLLDTNILIYLLDKKEKYVIFAEHLGDKTHGISVISVIELLTGVFGENEYFTAIEFLERFTIIPMDKDVGIRVAKTLQSREKKSLKNPKLGDIIIAETALSLHVPLITNNPKDFLHWKDLKIIVP